MRLMTRSLFVFSALLLCGSQIARPASAHSVPPSVSTQHQSWSSSAYDYRNKYAISCTIYIYHRRLFSVDISALSTYKINQCDPDTFRNTTAAAIRAQLSAFTPIDMVEMSGPQVQMMDKNTSVIDQPYISVGALNFSMISTSHIGIVQVVQHFSNWLKWRNHVTSYNPIRVQENVQYTWHPGSTVYTLTTDTGQTFLMSSFTPLDIRMDTADIDNDAANLGKFLNLPTGWKYEARTLNKILFIRRNEIDGYRSSRLADEFGNVYIGIDEVIQ